MASFLARQSLRLPKLHALSRGARLFHASAPAQVQYLDVDFVKFKRVTTGPGAENRAQVVLFYSSTGAGNARAGKALAQILVEIANSDDLFLTGSRLPLDLLTVDTDSEDGRELLLRYKVKVSTIIGFLRGKRMSNYEGAPDRAELYAYFRTL